MRSDATGAVPAVLVASFIVEPASCGVMVGFRQPSIFAYRVPSDGSAPCEDGLFQIVDAGVPAVQRNLAELEDDSGGGCVDEVAAERPLDDGLVGFGDRHEAGVRCRSRWW